MRILFWASTFWPHIGGVEVLGVALVRALRGRGHEIVVLARRDTWDLPAEDEYGGVRIVRHAFRQALERADPEAVATGRRFLARLAGEVRPDVLHLFHPGPDLLYRPALGPLPTVASLHQSYPPVVLGRDDGVVVRMLRDAGSVVACSAAVRDDLLVARPELAPKTVALPNRLPPGAVAAAPLPPSPVVLFVGRAVPQKGFDLGLEAFRIVRERLPDARLVVAGNGPELPRLVRQTAALELDEVVELRGWVAPDDVPALINAATVVAMPSRFEPFGLVALEAAQLGRPVVAFAVDGLLEAVVDGRTGVLVEPGNVRALADELTSLLADPPRARALGAEGTARFDRTHWEEYVTAVEELYRRAAGG